MSKESAKAFLERVKSDEEFAKQIAGAKSREERAEIAKAEGFDFMPEELKKATDELSDEELDAVDGGHYWIIKNHTKETKTGCKTPHTF